MNAALYLNDYKSVDSSLSVGDHTRLKHMINDALSTISLQPRLFPPGRHWLCNEGHIREFGSALIYDFSSPTYNSSHGP